MELQYLDGSDVQEMLDGLKFLGVLQRVPGYWHLPDAITTFSEEFKGVSIRYSLDYPCGRSRLAPAGREPKEATPNTYGFARGLDN